MPKGISKERTELTSASGCYEFLRKRPDTEKKMNICNKLLDSILKTKRNKSRRDKYITELRNCLTKLCVQSTDLIEVKEKLDETRNDLERQGRKRADLQDKVVQLEFENKLNADYKTRYESQVQSKLKLEEEFGNLLKQNEHLETRVDELKKTIKELKAQAKTSKK